MSTEELKQRRRAAQIPGSLLARRARVDRGRLSEIERGYVIPSSDELGRLSRALDELIEAKHKVAQVAEEVGWPL